MAGGGNGALDRPVSGEPRSANKAERQRIRELERELRRKDKALAEAAALLILSKKVEAMFRKDGDE